MSALLFVCLSVGVCISNCLRLLPRLLATSIFLSVFSSITWYSWKFLCKMWPIQLAFLLCKCRKNNHSLIRGHMAFSKTDGKQITKMLSRCSWFPDIGQRRQSVNPRMGSKMSVHSTAMSGRSNRTQGQVVVMSLKPPAKHGTSRLTTHFVHGTRQPRSTSAPGVWLWRWNTCHVRQDWDNGIRNKMNQEHMTSTRAIIFPVITKFTTPDTDYQSIQETVIQKRKC